MWDLWRKSSADVLEKWRDIADAAREGNALDRPDELPETLQIVFWFGALSGNVGEGSRRRAGLKIFLPESTVESLFRVEGTADLNRRRARKSA